MVRIQDKQIIIGPSRIIAMLIVLISLTSCISNADQSEIIDYEFKTINYKSPNCEPERDVCLILRLGYPVFEQGDSMAVYLANRIMRNSTLDFLTMGDVEATKEPSLEQVIDDMEKSFQKTKQEVGMSTGWQANLETTELYRNDTILVLRTNSMTYFGGAHPNRNSRFFNFDRRSGRFIPLSALVDLASFTAKSDSVFRNKYLPEGQAYGESNFNFLGDKFQLPANYAYLGDSILLHYNHYEIASFADGEFEISVSLK